MLTVAAAFAGFPAITYDVPAAAATPCIASGTEAAINAALVGPGARAILCPGATFLLYNPVTFTAPDQQLYTQDLPADSRRAILRLASAPVTTAVIAYRQSGVAVRNIQVDGNRSALGHANGGALLEMGAARDQAVEDTYVHDTRSWSSIHFIEGAVVNDTPECQNGRIAGNTVGPSGDDTFRMWADGISLACGHSLVEDNTVIDATDGGIVIFGAPGSTVAHNTITARTRTLLGGINMVDHAPFHGNFSGTTVRDNVIDAQGAFIKVGIAMGQQVWSCDPGVVYGGTVRNNALKGAYFGYGYAVNGVRNWTVSGNEDEARHVGIAGHGCRGLNAQPTGFQYQSESASTLQPQFRPATLTDVLNVSAPPDAVPDRHRVTACTHRSPS
ncbi:right-handed parallel beta-helix repeat-containing protein [Amycolatopsis decaplanina]|uniref:Uncharacterized protein n=1 Tax=Amycolatopsis decaplanina DSM 44594 TaxID=1284240 RepID=M2XC66_9PSEU|nr:right-handed parallel beta-helix repeat-containing protein [Amycolatopsis decaplanina]EME58696.1 hypothetical protein H074_18993 [Amycolatopsis decaplanina DSM 44594]